MDAARAGEADTVSKPQVAPLGRSQRIKGGSRRTGVAGREGTDKQPGKTELLRVRGGARKLESA